MHRDQIPYRYPGETDEQWIQRLKTKLETLYEDRETKKRIALIAHWCLILIPLALARLAYLVTQ